MQKTKISKKQPKAIASTQSLSSFVKTICDIMRRSNCASALQYVPELTWILFLRILDSQEQKAQEEAEALGNEYTPALSSPFRWQDWAAPYDEQGAKTPEGKPVGWQRHALFQAGDGQLFDFINNQLLPHLHSLEINPVTRIANTEASPKQRVIGRIMTAVEKVRVDSETNLLDIFDKVNEIHSDHIDDTHFFTLSQVYEDLLLKMGEKNSDGGQFFTPREVIRAMVHVLDPQPLETIYDPCCGTGGFLAVAFEHINKKLGNAPAAMLLDTLKHETFFGREKENLVFPIALANLILHGIDQPNLWHGNTLTAKATYSGLFEKAPSFFDVILTNPPFGGKEGGEAQKNYDFETGSTQVLFLQHILSELKPPENDDKPGGRCGIVLDEGLLFRNNESAFVETKRKLVDECDVWCIVSLPGGVFSTAGAGVKTNLLFFTKGKSTERIWYYDLSQVKVGKKSPMTLAHFGFDKNGGVLAEAELPTTLMTEWLADEQNQDKPYPSFARLLAKHGTTEADSEFSWTIDFAARRAKAREDMLPFQEEVKNLTEELLPIREALKALKKHKSDQVKISQAEDKIKAKEKAIREAQTKIADIDAAVYDLKAVNPNIKAATDTRTVQEIINNINIQADIVAKAMANLREMLTE